MGKRSQSRTKWPTRHDAPCSTHDEHGHPVAKDWTHPHTVRRWICAGCRKEVQLVNCADGAKRCPSCKAAFDREREASQSAPIVAPSPPLIQPAGQLVTPPRVG